ncbi:hypothetical protein EON80_19620 [bacterium]|nr:MAG: hypothetical protein EON80_19620 [bacterium]
MKNAVLLIFATIGLSWNTAQAEPIPEGAEKVLYTPKIPAQVRKRMRVHGTTRFYGETVIQGKTVELHLYNTRRPKKERFEATVTDIEQDMQLDIFLKSQRNNRVILERVQALPITFSGFKKGKSKVVFHAMWLDPSANTIPLIKLDLESQATSGGMVGNEVLFVFPKGLKGAIAQQTFYYDFLEGPVGISGSSFSHTDSRGYLTRLQSGMDGMNLDLEGMKWNGKQFVTVARAHENRDSSVRVEWTGEKMEYIDQAQPQTP